MTSVQIYRNLGVTFTAYGLIVQSLLWMLLFIIIFMLWQLCITPHSKYMVKFSFLLHVFHLLFLKKKDLVLYRSLFPTILKEKRIHTVLCCVIHTEDADDKLQEDNSYLPPAGG